VYRRGIQVSDVGTGIAVTGNTIDNIGLESTNGIGIMSFGGNGAITNNTITRAAVGIATNFADTTNGTGPVQAAITGNQVTVRTLTLSGTVGGVGLLLYGLVGGSTVTGNTVTPTADPNADYGILFADTRSGTTTISANIVTGSGGDLGIIVSETAAASQPIMSGNTLTSTTATAATPGGSASC
jgi:hypothetical protein